MPKAPMAVGVIGLGRFGSEVARSLERLGHNVLAIDEDQAIVERWAEQITVVLQADSTDDAALRQVGVPELDRVVVGIGSDIEASVLTVVALKETGVGEIWARASSTRHAKILSLVGADRVLYPECDQAERIAQLTTSKMLDFIEFDGFAVAKTRVPPEAAGYALASSRLRGRYGVTVIGFKAPDAEFEYGRADSVLPSDATLIVTGTIDQVRDFAAAT